MITQPSPTPWRRLIDRLDAGGASGSRELFAVEAPLRVCPLGAHVDHQGGVVTGMALDRAVRLVAVPQAGRRVTVESFDFSGAAEIDLDAPAAPPRGDWSDYLAAAVATVRERYGVASGLRATLSGELAGAGVSSSAAVLVASTMALARAGGLELDRRELVELVREAENRRIGVASGRLDPAVILFAERGALTRIDCNDFAVEQVASPDGGARVALLVLFSGVARSLVHTGYNARVEECREAARRLGALAGQPIAEPARLVDVAPETFEQLGDALPPALRRRATHFFGEAARVREGIDAWRSGDLVRFGHLVSDSGTSSIENYECGTAPLVALQELLVAAPGVLGARFSGAGFGGACLALVEPGAEAEVADRVAAGYRARFPELAERAGFHVCASSGGARFVEKEELCRR